MLNSSRVYLDDFAARAAASVPEGARVLDAGAGTSPYRKHFVAQGHRYESADFGEVDKAYGDLTYRCRLDDIPVEDARYNLVLMSQVMEHLPEPGVVLRELRRVLKPSGALWLSAPLYYEEHEQPYDFFRYTQFGFRHLLETNGFVVEELDWLEGYAGTVSYQLRRAARNLPHRPRHYGGGGRGLATAAAVAAAKPVMYGLALLLASADVRAKWTRTGHCKNYCVVARAAEPAEAKATR